MRTGKKVAFNRFLSKTSSQPRRFNACFIPFVADAMSHIPAKPYFISLPLNNEHEY